MYIYYRAQGHDTCTQLLLEHHGHAITNLTDSHNRWELHLLILYHAVIFFIFLFLFVAVLDLFFLFISWHTYIRGIDWNSWSNIEVVCSLHMTCQDSATPIFVPLLVCKCSNAVFCFCVFIDKACYNTYF